jgi:hypothetical protein
MLKQSMLYKRADKHIQDFEKKLKDALFFSREYGVFTTSIELASKETYSRKNYERLVSNCHSGFKKAQSLIIEEIINIQEKRTKIETQLKVSREKRDKQEVDKLNKELNFELFKEIVYRRIADSVVWQMIYGHYYVARRLYVPRKNNLFSKLLNSNLEHTIKEIDKLNKNVNDFALMVDITSFVGVGDIILKTQEGIKVIELKEGIKNQQIKDIIKDKADTSLEELLKDLKQSTGENLFKQARRMLNQSNRMQSVEDVVNIGKGKDHQTGQPMFVPDLFIETDNFIEKLVDLINQVHSTNKDWAYDVVECVHIGVYKNKFLSIGCHLIRQIIEAQTGESYPVFNLIGNLEEPLSAPIFIEHPLRIDQIIDIVMGDIKIYISIDFNEFLNMFKSWGAECSWASRSETAKIPNNDTIFKFKNRAITFKYNKCISYLGLGSLFRILYSNTLPSSIILANLESIKAWESEIIKTGISTDDFRDKSEIIEDINLNFPGL